MARTKQLARKSIPTKADLERRNSSILKAKTARRSEQQEPESSVKARPGRAKAGQSKGGAKRSAPGESALRQIRQYQRSTELLIQKAPFSRLVREVMESVQPGLRIQVPSALYSGLPVLKLNY